MAIVVMAAVAATLATRAMSWFFLRDIAHVQDEITYVLEAKTFALGHLVAPVIQPRAAFNMWFVEDRWARFGIFPPGWPMVLMLGELAGAPRWVNPILHGLTVPLVAKLAGRLQPRAMVPAALVYAFSPQALLLASSVMSHTLVALCACVVLLYCVGAIQEGTTKVSMACAVGMALALCATTRPLCLCVLALTLAGTFVYRAYLARAITGPFVLDAVIIAVPMACGIALLLAYNRALTGDALRFPQSLYFDEHLPPADLPFFRYFPGCNDLGFGPGHGCDETIFNATHTVFNAASNAGDNWSTWFLLAGGGPLFALTALYALWRSRTANDPDGSLPAKLVLFLTVASTVALYSLYWHPGTCFGARFYHVALPGVLALATVGIAQFRSRRLEVAAFAAWGVLSAVGLAVAVREVGHAYWGTDERFADVKSRWDRPPAVVMVAFAGEDLKVPPYKWTAHIPDGAAWMLNIRAESALGMNSPNVDDQVVFAKFHPALVDTIREHFPGRALWFYVMAPDREKDTLVPYTPDVITRDEMAISPPDNFDGYRVELPPRADPPPRTGKHSSAARAKAPPP